MPFIISWPGHVPAGRTDSSSVVTALDLLPSLSRMCNVNLPASYKGDGVNRAAVLKGKPSERTADIFWEYGRNDIAYSYPKAMDKSPALAIRSGRWKLLMNADGSNRELYDMLTDPGEKTNIVAANEKLAAKLQVKLQNWWSQLPKLKE